ncbi:MAG TPA: uracil-DNA glycosylase [Mycobacteriales bacterium]|nr:uracil-DNA glycosylase [Mycobacteriales bacterium]
MTPGRIGPLGPGRPGGPKFRLVPGSLEVANTAARCRTWDELAAGCRVCTACPELVRSRGQVVVGDAPARARAVLVGEAPGAQEDAAGRPFVGRAGQLLDELLTRAGLRRAELAVLNVVQCRPPGNRAPRSEEIARCRGWLERKLDLLGSDLVCALGLTAAGWFLGRGGSLSRLRGRVHPVAGRRVVVTYHPAAAVRFGPAGAPRAALAEDLELLARLMDE